MNNKTKVSLMLFAVLFLSLSACNLGGQAPSVDAEPPTAEPPAPISVPADTPTAVPTAIQHEMMPGDLPPNTSGRAGDQDSSTTAPENRAPGGDRFTFGRYERPFNPDAMDVYHSYIDIIFTAVYVDNDWIYALITLKDDGTGKSLDGRYGFEIDVDLNGGGDWLVLVSKPSSTEWTTDGVQVWYDENNDVGGTAKSQTDSPPFRGDGFEKKMFGDGDGDDPDLAFARIAPDDPYTVHLAVKRSILRGVSQFMVGMWAGNALFDPALFDHNDNFTHDEAGSSLVEFEFFYPIKSVYELDNACRIPVGFMPTGNMPGMCPLPPAAEGDDTPPASCPPEYLYCFNFGAQQVCYCLQPVP
jgi:hypothetical protein